MADPVWTWSGPSIAANCQGGPRRARPTPPPTIMAIASALPRLLTGPPHCRARNDMAVPLNVVITSDNDRGDSPRAHIARTRLGLVLSLREVAGG